MIDYLACPNCGEPRTDGRLCNLTCRREFTKKQRGDTHEGIRIIERRVAQEAILKHQVARFVTELEEANRVNQQPIY